MTTFTGPDLADEGYVGALTYGGFLDEIAERYGDREAIVSSVPGKERLSWTYAEFRAQARSIAKALIAAGVSRGTRVGLLAGSRPEWPATLWGATMAGAVLVPFNTFLKQPELDYLLRHSDVSVLITDESLLRHRYVDDLVELCPEAVSAPLGAIYAEAYPFLRRIVVFDVSTTPGPGFQSWENFLADGARVPDEIVDGVISETVPTEDAVIIYTSGTTSRPKGALHVHRAPLLQSWRHGFREGLQPTDRILSAFPLFWTTGITFILGSVFASGACYVITPFFDASESLRLIEQERISIVYCWAHQLAALREIQDKEQRDVSHVRHVGSIDSGFQLTGIRNGEEEHGRHGYGLTEAFTYISGVPVGSPFEERSSNGGILPGNKVRFIDTESGDELGRGQEGEIIFKGPTVMRRYVKVAPDLTFDDEGYFHSGDSGYLDEKGLLHWTGRLTNIIKTAGADVSPLEVESAILARPDVKGVIVVGVPDPQLGQIVVACVVARSDSTATEDELREFLRVSLSSYKVPRRVLFFDDEELPKTGSNKFDISAARAIAAKRVLETSA